MVVRGFWIREFGGSPVPSRKVAFFFLGQLAWGRMLTIDMLNKGGRILQIGEESANHLLISWKMIWELWSLVFALFGFV